MKTSKKLLLIAVMTAVTFAACTSTPKNKSKTTKRTKPQTEESLKTTVRLRPRSAKAYYDLGYFYCFNDLKNRRSVLAAREWEKALELDPNFRVNVEFKLTPQAASALGLKTPYDIAFSDFSLNFLLAQELRTAAISTNTNPEIAVDKNEKQSTLEKALILYRKGYDIDITGGKCSGTTMKSVYLSSIAFLLDKMGRTTEANSTYKELANVTTVTDSIARRIGIVTESMRIAEQERARKEAEERAKEAEERATAEKKAAIAKLAADNPQLYPAPFEGRWMCTIPGTPSRTETYYETVTESYGTGSTLSNDGRLIPGETKYRTRKEARTRTIPGTPSITIYLVFAGKNYIDGKQTGTFFYKNSTIELDNGTILEFTNNKIRYGNILLEKQ
jgi:tetratricopeptide (TPR) repeat protein